jgi:hypothetical protein
MDASIAVSDKICLNVEIKTSSINHTHMALFFHEVMCGLELGRLAKLLM